MFGAEDVVEIKMGSRRFQKDETACVSFDGDTPEHLHVGDRVRIAQAQSTIRICKIRKCHFSPVFMLILTEVSAAEGCADPS